MHRHKGETVVAGWERVPTQMESLTLSSFGSRVAPLKQLIDDALRASFEEQQDELNVFCLSDMWGGSWALTASRGGDAITSGDAIVDVESTVDMESKEMVDRATLSASQLADNALYAFLKVVVDIANSNENGQLRQYRNDPRLASRFPDGYSVKMGYGLHLGWAIEGAIGSRLKIDASYLSPNVNMASRLEAATKQYGTPILMSHLFANSLSPAAYRFCRRIDKVTVKASLRTAWITTRSARTIPS